MRNLLDRRQYRPRQFRLHLFALAFSCVALDAVAGSLDTARLADDLRRLSASFDGRIGICARHRQESACVRGDERFPMQSVMKLVVAVAVLDAVDRSHWRLDDEIVVRPSDLSIGVQPIARFVTPDGYRTSVRAFCFGPW